MNDSTLNFLTKNCPIFAKDLYLLNFFYKRRNDKEYLNKVLIETKKDISILEIDNNGLLTKRKEELKYITYLLEQ